LANTDKFWRIEPSSDP